MKIKVDYPKNLVPLKGLNIPKLEGIQQAVRLADIVVKYLNPRLDDVDLCVFTISVSDEAFVSDGKLVDCHDTGEGITLHPSARPWTVESIFELIFASLYGDEPDSRAVIPVINLAEIAETLKTLIDFTWALPDKLPDGSAKTMIDEFCIEHEHIVDTYTSVKEVQKCKRY